MKFSSYAHKFDSDSSTVQLMQDLGHADEARKHGPVYMLGGGNPAHIPEIETVFQQALMALVSDSQAFGKMVGEYDAPQGNKGFCDALAALLSDNFGWALTAENIAVTNGSQSSFGLLFNALGGPHEDGTFKKILLPLLPEYVGYSDVGLYDEPLFEGKLPTIDKLENGFFKYRLDLEHLQIDNRYGAVCVSRPTNPTGNVITDDELQALAVRCERAGVPLIIDGAYGLPFPGIVFGEATPLWNENIILCLSLSKLGLPGLRTGIVVGHPKLIELIRNANAINSLAPGRVGPQLAERLLNGGQMLDLCKTTITPHYRSAMEFAVSRVKETMQDIPVWIHQPEGALFIWLWFEGLPIKSSELYKKLVERGVYVIAGEHFYPGLEEECQHRYECIRVNYAAGSAVVAEGIEIIADTVREIYASN